jgi:predicted DNA-binding transcriptional regulator YafY
MVVPLHTGDRKQGTRKAGDMIRITSIAQAEKLITRAIARTQPVTLTYTRADGVETLRTVEPYGAVLESKAGDLYVKAMDRESGETRSWRLDRISFLTIHRTYFLIKNPTNEKEVFMAIDAEKNEAPEGVGAARVGHVTDVRDTRPAFGITYRRYQDTRSSFLRVQAKDVREAMSALTAHVGGTQYAVTSIRQDPAATPAAAALVSPEFDRVARMLLATNPESEAGADAVKELDALMANARP